MALIFFASSVPGDQLPGHFWDKAVHFLVYGGLGVLFLLPLTEATVDRLTVRAGILAILFAVVYGAFDEIHQAFTPERTPDLRDLLADGLGASLGVLVVFVLVAIWKRLARLRQGSGEVSP
jgi:VanZ family protein